MGTDAFVLPLDDPGADLDAVGGKGASLAALVRAGLPVPGGFHVTTHAYRVFADGLTPEGFAARPVPPVIASAILAALPDGPVAVRSSATAEDLPDLSFAGQHDTVLDVRGEDVLDAVKRCWASLWTERAVAYRARNGVTDAAMAVVVQELVPADAAGVLFTADPVTGARDEIVVNAAPGLGEALVAGEVTPDTYVVSSGVVRSDGDVRSGGGVLDERQVLELAALGARVQDLYGVPVDVEWARHDGRFAILQARPITALAEVWNDSLRGDYLWTCANLGEAVPSVMTPATWSAAQVLAQPAIGGHPTTGNIGGRFYLNLSAALAVGTAVGLGGVTRRLAERVFGRLPEGVVVPGLPMPRLAVVRASVAALASFARQNREYAKRIGGLIDAAPARAAHLRARIAAATTPAELRALWESDLDALLRDDIRVYDAGARSVVGADARLRRTLVRLVGEQDATALLTGAHGAAGDLASLGPVLALARLRRGELDRETYLRDWGHRFADEYELSAPRPAEDPAWLDRLPAADGPDPEDLLARQAAARDAAWRRLVAAHPRRAARIGRRLAAFAESTRGRERARSEMVRGFGVLRSFLVRAADLTGHDVFFLSLTETLAVLDGDRRPVAAIPARRRAYERYRSLPPYPTVIRGRFDPEAWAADPDRRTDVHDASAAPPPAAVAGFPGAAGVVEGVARVLLSVEDGAALREGEVLVTTVTNIGWTPLFPRAAAVVTDVGAPLSHAAIVARELGIPAVVGCGNATTRIRTGDRVRVDGGRGTVTRLDPGGRAAGE
ncbi:PEP/pyruvate-binding domain-containing protein [Saccharothrix australiensis]|uniref:Pyruvate,water dikinase n=1 Tax=Saccharothrix australiensis TaxID=2072 RepID=A0A495W0S2_9PSEU|nr:PEP/pyruvate-binding domain-containing protein [Saccharothrix australiensis]RKT55069.1 pyruvate,water dikinase [Saccharothrix australiensis]